MHNVPANTACRPSDRNPALLLLRGVSAQTIEMLEMAGVHEVKVSVFTSDTTPVLGTLIPLTVATPITCTCKLQCMYVCVLMEECVRF